MSSPNLTPPKVETLKQLLKQSNKKADLLAKIEIVAFFVMLVWLPWPILLENPFITLIIIGVAFIQNIIGYGALIFLNKKEIRHLQDHTALGNFHRQDLLDIIRQVLTSMGQKNTSIKVYLLADKDINASAIKVGFSKLFPALNAVYLNRSVLHLLKADELKFLLGHEFGHVFKYRERWRDYDILHICTTAVAGLWILCLLQATEGYLFFVVIMAQFAIQYLLNLPSGRLARVIEYLCDYNGMQTSSLLAAVNTTLKLGHESEAHQMVFFKIFEASKSGTPLSPHDIYNIYEDSLPYGYIDHKESEKQISKLAQQTRKSKSGISFEGWLEFVRGQDSENEDYDQQIKEKWKFFQSMPVLPWREATQWSPKLDYKNLNLEKLLEVNQHYPNGFLFKLDSELPNRHLVHPSFSNRINFLAANQYA